MNTAIEPQLNHLLKTLTERLAKLEAMQPGDVIASGLAAHPHALQWDSLAAERLIHQLQQRPDLVRRLQQLLP